MHLYYMNCNELKCGLYEHIWVTAVTDGWFSLILSCISNGQNGKESRATTNKVSVGI